MLLFRPRTQRHRPAGLGRPTSTPSTSFNPPPPAPSQLLVTPLSVSQVVLSWKENYQTVSGYTVERQNADGSWSVIATVGAGDHHLRGTAGLTPGTQYVYRITATNSFGNSPAQQITGSTAPASGDGNPCPPVGCVLWLQADARHDPGRERSGRHLDWTNRVENFSATQPDGGQTALPLVGRRNQRPARPCTSMGNNVRSCTCPTASLAAWPPPRFFVVLRAASPVWWPTWSVAFSPTVRTPSIPSTITCARPSAPRTGMRPSRGRPRSTSSISTTSSAAPGAWGGAHGRPGALPEHGQHGGFFRRVFTCLARHATANVLQVTLPRSSSSTMRSATVIAVGGAITSTPSTGIIRPRRSPARCPVDAASSTQLAFVPGRRTIPGVDHYTIERQGTDGTWAAVAHRLTATTSHYVDGGLTPATSYGYRITATKQSWGNRRPPIPATGTTGPAAGPSGLFPVNGLRLWLQADTGVSP